MQLLIDFANTRTWNDDTLAGIIDRLADAAKARREGGNIMEVERHTHPADLYGLTIPVFFDLNGKNDEERLRRLKRLQTLWRVRLKKTARSGPDPAFLNRIIGKSKFFLSVNDADPFTPQAQPMYSQYTTFAQWIEGEYLSIFLSGDGQKFRALRECHNQECRNLFLSNRKTHRFCQEPCKHKFHNEIKVESGYMKKYMADGRAAGRYY
ncbi:MAG: hypothetical protein AB1568_10520 [Thermodesulfobacteriota bacterium]